MNGREVYKHAVRNMAASARDGARGERPRRPTTSTWVIAHQANLRILEGVSERVGIPMERFFLNVDRYGNTSSASVPTALDEAIEQRQAPRGRHAAVHGARRRAGLGVGGGEVVSVALAAEAKAAFVFPGQGSQKVGMGRALHDAYPEARAVFAEADDALGYPLSKLCFEGPEAELTLTANAQPAILATSVAALRVLEARSPVRPVAVAGHSLGEYSALVAAGALRLADAVRLVHLRGKFMQDAVPAGRGRDGGDHRAVGATTSPPCAARPPAPRSSAPRT